METQTPACHQCGRTDLPLIPTRVTDVTFLGGHVLVGQRGGRERSYSVEICPPCLANLIDVPGGDTVKVEPDLG